MFTCLFAHRSTVSSTGLQHLISIVADAVKSSEDEEDDESSSEENKLSSELSTSNEKLDRKASSVLSYVYVFLLLLY